MVVYPFMVGLIMIFKLNDPFENFISTYCGINYCFFFFFFNLLKRWDQLLLNLCNVTPSNLLHNLHVLKEKKILIEGKKKFN